MLTFRDPKTFLFFTATKISRHAANAFLVRLNARKSNPQCRRHAKGLPAPAQGDYGLGNAILAGTGRHPSAGTRRQWRPRHHGPQRELARRIPDADLVLYPTPGTAASSSITNCSPTLRSRFSTPDVFSRHRKHRERKLRN
ncbi:hypothetical protein [Sphingomonas faeni]|uniref:hypothetical protein n=1 Tax=Sphingomonas faeni TaxID=185950 RepID=UPI00278B2F1D|nr:hypothetical protein [Sphingomonas faeni]MDQ0837037.1 hypothetical protein [Sphingomonas faeni]